MDADEKAERAYAVVALMESDQVAMQCMIRALIDTHPDRAALLEALRFQFRRWTAEGERMERELKVKPDITRLEDDRSAIEEWIDYLT